MVALNIVSFYYFLQCIVTLAFEELKLSISKLSISKTVPISPRILFIHSTNIMSSYYVLRIVLSIRNTMDSKMYESASKNKYEFKCSKEK